jgi:hypothetical protein
MKMQDRVFTTKDKDGEEVVLKFKRPSQTVLSKAELSYRTAFSRAFRQDIITNAEVEKLLRDRGLWDEDQQKKVNELRSRIGELEESLEDTDLSNEQGKAVCEELDKLRLEIMSANAIYQTIADNTCETIATEERNQFLCSECVVDNKTGLRVYKNVDDFKSRMDEPTALDAFRETVIATLEVAIGRSLPSNLSDEYAENKWRTEREREDVEEAEAEETEDTEDDVEEVEEAPAPPVKKKKKRVRKTS